MHRDGSSIVAISCLVEKGRAKYWLNVLARRCKPVDTYWPQSVKYIVNWATQAIDRYKVSKGLKS
jgi:hypothetical protein